MERLIYDTKYSKIEIISEMDGVQNALKHYFYSYGNIRCKGKEDSNTDAKIYIFKRKSSNSNEIKINKKTQEIGINVDNLDVENQLLIKRLLINLNNRILESKGMIFIHASSVCVGDSGIIFIGNRGNGKTTNMLYMLEHENVMYVSNDRTGIKLDEGTKKVVMVGIPSRINVRPGTMEQNKVLKGKLLSILKEKDYETKLKYQREAGSMKSRMAISIQELKESLGIEEKPFCELKSVILVDYNPNIKLQIEGLTEGEMIQLLEEQRIGGVFSGTKEIEDIIDVPNRRIEDILRGRNISAIRVTQNCDNSQEILKYLFEKKGEQENERE